MKSSSSLLVLVLIIFGCSQSEQNKPEVSIKQYFDYGDTGVKTGGVKMIKIQTPKGEFNVWTRRFGNNPKIKVLLLHGGPGGTHEDYECFESFFPKEDIEFYEYDQLGSYYSDQPKDSSLWVTERFVEEVEQVRKALGMNKDNFYLLGSSWGGILAMEYALKYQDNLKGLIISNMMSSCPDYDKYSEVLAKQMDPVVVDTIRALEARSAFSDPKYMSLLTKYFYNEHLCRVPVWPDAVNRAFKHMNPEIYVLMQGPSEFGISGRLENWDVKARLKEIRVPTLTIGGKYDTMDPEHMKWMSTEVQKGRYLFCPEGSHLSRWDDQQHFFPGVISFIHDVDEGRF